VPTVEGPDKQIFDFDIALSFAGEDRARAERVAALLTAEGVRVFYDRYETAQLWGKDLYQHLQSIYRDRAKYCVIFVSEAYARKLWTKHELKQAQARAFREHSEYILPLRLDDTEIPGLNATVGYVDLRHTDDDEVHNLILRKLYGGDADVLDAEELTWRGELVEFRGTEVASFWPKKLREAQDLTTYLITRRVPRIRYGDEHSHRLADSQPCGDCAAVKGEYHTPGCDIEECPACGGQALSCDCDKVEPKEPDA
jgi:hypothetical protein